MARIEIARLRKDHGMSQNELAQHLQITQSFLSAIENGKSPLPTEKEARILEIFSLHDLSGYTAEPAAEGQSKNIAEMSESDLIRQLLNRFHSQTQNKETETRVQVCNERISELEQCNSALLMHTDNLLQRNEKLSVKNDELRTQVDSLRDEIFRLKSLLSKNKIAFD